MPCVCLGELIVREIHRLEAALRECLRKGNVGDIWEEWGVTYGGNRFVGEKHLKLREPPRQRCEL